MCLAGPFSSIWQTRLSRSSKVSGALYPRLLASPAAVDLVCLSSQAGLQRFKKLVVLANIHFDTMVPYTTAAITMEDPYEKSKSFIGISRSQPAACPDKFPSIRRPCVDEELLARDDQPPIGGSWVPIVALLLLPILLVPLLLTLGIMVFKVGTGTEVLMCSCLACAVMGSVGLTANICCKPPPQGRRHYKSLLHLRPESSWLVALPRVKAAAAAATLPVVEAAATAAIASSSDEDPSMTDDDSKIAIKASIQLSDIVTSMAKHN